MHVAIVDATENLTFSCNNSIRTNGTDEPREVLDRTLAIFQHLAEAKQQHHQQQQQTAPFDPNGADSNHVDDTAQHTSLKLTIKLPGKTRPVRKPSTPVETASTTDDGDEALDITEKRKRKKKEPGGEAATPTAKRARTTTAQTPTNNTLQIQTTTSPPGTNAVTKSLGGGSSSNSHVLVLPSRSGSLMNASNQQSSQQVGVVRNTSASGAPTSSTPPPGAIPMQPSLSVNSGVPTTSGLPSSIALNNGLQNRPLGPPSPVPEPPKKKYYSPSTEMVTFRSYPLESIFLLFFASYDEDDDQRRYFF
jgi:hypothetical protein